uniref:Low-density lipoprotein receptor-related protein 8-like n=1 Tax=Gouania willdenowi TaxID=441366 RepID=A0A8C5D9L3_GOUWI
MGHLGGLLVLISPLIWIQTRGAVGHSLPICNKRLEFSCSDGGCVSLQLVCNGQNDCEDGSDENQCGDKRCKNDEFSCTNRQCISTRSLCNGIDDCGDGSDEASCPMCDAGLFFCGPSDACLPNHKLCDGQADCQNGNDELKEFCGSTEAAPQTSSECTASEFPCGDGLCIRQSWRCDHSADCEDGSDEVGCEQDECRINNGGCSHHCMDQPMGFICSCPDHMKLLDDTQCVQVNTCLESDVCDQRCVYVNGRLTCDCTQGYLKNLTSGKCQAEGGGAQLAFTTSKGAQLLQNMTNIRHRELAPYLPGNGPVVTLSWNRTLYWAQRGQTLIYRISLDKKPQKPVVVLQTHSSVTSLAIDWIHLLFYWTSMEMGSVNVALLDGSAQRELVTMLAQPSAVAVDPLQGFLFWTQCGSFPKIERSGLDGRDRIPLITKSLHRPLALALDIPRHLLYWYDQQLRSISRVDFDGHHRKTVVESNGYLDQVFGLSVFEGWVFWSDDVTHSICQADKHNGTNLKVLLSHLTSPGGLVILHPALQPKVFFSVLLVGLTAWWWKGEFRSSRPLDALSFALKESQDPLITRGPLVAPRTSVAKETLLKPQLDGQ